MGFEKWDYIHDTCDQQKRLERAKSAACTPLSISADEAFGVFSGSHGTYETTLEKCSCGDFIRRKLPCKHMYRLAIELGVLNEEAGTDATQIKRPVPVGLSLKEAVAVIESVGEDAQRVLHDVLYTMFYHTKSDIVGVRLTDGLGALVNAGVLILCDDLPTLLGTYRRNELRDALINAGIDGFKKSAGLKSLIQWICENVPDARSLFSNAAVVCLADKFKKPSRKMYTYLNRRNEVEYYYDEDMVERTIPKGAQRVLSGALFGSSNDKPSLSLEFPNDEITDLLDQYGVNRCRTWTYEKGN